MPPETNPKILHRIYFDNFAPYHDPFEHFLDSWKREMPEYRVMRWNQSNLDVDANSWTRRAYEAKQPVFLAEYFRWKILMEHGGVYLDADCEILDGNVFDRIVGDLYATDDYDCFFGVEERDNGNPTAQTIGAKRHSSLIRHMRSLYEDHLAPLWEWREKRGLIGPQLMALYYLDRKVNVEQGGYFTGIDEPTVIDRAKVYPQAYFSPKFSLLGDKLAVEAGRTCVYHMFANSNVDFSKNKQMQVARDRALTFAEYQVQLEKQASFPRTFDASWLRSGAAGEYGLNGIRSVACGVITHGPYITLGRGRYVAQVNYSCDTSSAKFKVHVTADKGREAVGEGVAPEVRKGDGRIGVPFEITQDVSHDVEVVVTLLSGDGLNVSSVEFHVADGPPQVGGRPIGDHGSAGASSGSLRKIHRIYFGFDGKPDPFLAYLKTWQDQLPDFEILHWSASNLPMEINDYVRRLHAERDHAFLTDYFRWYLLKEYGGTYFDADVEVVDGAIYRRLITELESAPSFDAFIGIDERSGGWYTAHSMASKPQSDLATFMCEVYANFGRFAAWRKKGLYFWAPQLVGLFFANRNHNVGGMGTTPALDRPTVAARVKIYPQDWFSPLAPGAPSSASPFQLSAVSENTCLCHHFACSWHEADSVYRRHSESKGGQTGALLSDLLREVSSVAILDADRLVPDLGRRTQEGIATTGRLGVLLRTPRVALPAGRYEVAVRLKAVEQKGSAVADVVDVGHGTALATPARFEAGPNGDVVRIPFVTNRSSTTVQFRLAVDEAADFAVRSVSFEPASSAPH